MYVLNLELGRIRVMRFVRTVLWVSTAGPSRV